MRGKGRIEGVPRGVMRYRKEPLVYHIFTDFQDSLVIGDERGIVYETPRPQIW